MTTVREQIERQLTSNLRALPYYETFGEHRQRQTALTLPVPLEAPSKKGVGPDEATDAEDKEKTLCVLGAGNCFDLDLELLARHYERIHLVDVDEAALVRAKERQDEATQRRLVLHAPVDLSGCHGMFERWRAMQVSADELMAVPTRVSDDLARQLPGGFDTVLSACLLSQLLLSLRRVLGERHPLFEAATLVLTLAHLRTLVRLGRRGSRVLLVTDVTSSEIATLPVVEAGTDQRPLLERLSSTGKLFRATAPSTLGELVHEDPILRRDAVLSPPLDAWTWDIGNERRFLVTALRFTLR